MNVEAAIRRNSMISAVGEVGNHQNNLVLLCECVEWINIKGNNSKDKSDVTETRISENKRRFELVVNEFNDGSNTYTNKRSSVEMKSKLKISFYLVEHLHSVLKTLFQSK